MDSLIPEDQKDHVRQTLLSFLEEPDFAVSCACCRRVGAKLMFFPDRSTTAFPTGFSRPYRTSQTMDLPPKHTTPESPNLLIPLVDKRDVLYDSYRPRKHLVDDQCANQRMEERQDSNGC